MKAAFFGLDDQIDYVYACGRRDKVAALTNLYPVVITKDNLDEHLDQLQDLEVIFSTWGMFVPTPEQFNRMPSLKAVFYAAGATDYFAMPFLERNITVMSAWQANAVPVAEFAAAQIVLGLKGFFRNSRELKSKAMWNRNLNAGPGVFEESVALIGAGAIAQKTHDFLKNYDINVIVVPSRKEKRTVSLEEAFSTAFVVSNHLPNRDDNVGVINGEHFRSMREGAVFVNTGRGAQVNETEMIEVLKERPDLTVLLDVTWPEPPEDDSELYTLPNVHLSAHIAGSINNEVIRMADYAIDEFVRWKAGEPMLYRISEDMLMTT